MQCLVWDDIGKLVKTINAQDGETIYWRFPPEQFVSSEKMDLVYKISHNSSDNFSEDRDFKLSEFCNPKKKLGHTLSTARIGFRKNVNSFYSDP